MTSSNEQNYLYEIRFALSSGKILDNLEFRYFENMRLSLEFSQPSLKALPNNFTPSKTVNTFVYFNINVYYSYITW